MTREELVECLSILVFIPGRFSDTTLELEGDFLPPPYDDIALMSPRSSGGYGTKFLPDGQHVSVWQVTKIRESFRTELLAAGNRTDMCSLHHLWVTFREPDLGGPVRRALGIPAASEDFIIALTTMGRGQAAGRVSLESPVPEDDDILNGDILPFVIPDFPKIAALARCGRAILAG
jgi:hypothetical protein